MMLTEWLAALLIVAGVVFFIAGTVGLFRFPDTHSRLHALTKADNLGLGLVVAGLMLTAPNIYVMIMLALVWFLVLFGAGLASHLLAQKAGSAGSESQTGRE